MSAKLKLLLGQVAGSIAALTALAVMSGTCTMGPCATAVTDLGECWQLSLDECLEYYGTPRVVNRAFDGELDDGYVTQCDGCELQTPSAGLSVTWGETRKHDLCFSATVGFTIRHFIGFKISLGGQYCWSKITSQEVQLHIDCEPGYITTVRAIEHRESADVEYDVDFKRRLTVIPQSGDDCPPDPPGQNPQVVHVIPCGTTTFSEPIEFKSWFAVAEQLHCPNEDDPFGHD